MSMEGCTSDLVEPFALRVIGDSMMPEFEDGAIIIVDQSAPCGSGAYAVIEYNGETTFSQYIEEDGHKFLRPLNPSHPTIELVGDYKVHGVVIQKYYKRKRKHYDWVS
jgi:DNA polymerase V